MRRPLKEGNKCVPRPNCQPNSRSMALNNFPSHYFNFRMERCTIPDPSLIEIVNFVDPERKTAGKKKFSCLDGGVSEILKEGACNKRSGVVTRTVRKTSAFRGDRVTKSIN